MSSVTDPYQPIERKVRFTRAILDALVRWQSKVQLVVQTRSPYVLDDTESLVAIAENGGRVQVNMTVTTDDEEVRRTFEPHCPGNRRRLDAIEQLTAAKVQTCITMTPLLWLRNADEFSDRLIATRVKRFIVQSFHFSQGRFIAQTRQKAFQLMAERLACDLRAFPQRYLDRYRNWCATLRSRLQQERRSLGEGKSGFAPPFDDPRHRTLTR